MPRDCLQELFSDGDGNFVCQRNGHGIANHFISVVNVAINEFKIIGKALNASNLSNRHAPVQMFLALYKATVVLSEENHFGSLRMKLTVPPGRLYGESLFVPRLYTVATHEDCRTKKFADFSSRQARFPSVEVLSDSICTASPKTYKRSRSLCVLDIRCGQPKPNVPRRTSCTLEKYL